MAYWWLRISYFRCNQWWKFSSTWQLFPFWLHHTLSFRQPPVRILLEITSEHVISTLGWFSRVRLLATQCHIAWWRHQMETFSALLALCAGNSPVTGAFPAQGPVTRSFDVSLICAWINSWVNNREWGWWFETPSRSLWRPCNESATYRRSRVAIHSVLARRSLRSTLSTLALTEIPFVSTCTIFSATNCFNQWYLTA